MAEDLTEGHWAVYQILAVEKPLLEVLRGRLAEESMWGRVGVA
jgi:hypothetical protein